MANFEKETRHQFFVFFINKQTTVNSAKCESKAHTRCILQLTQAWCVNCPLTVLLHCPITSRMCTLPVSAQIGLVLANHIQEFCYHLDWGKNFIYSYFHYLIQSLPTCIRFPPRWQRSRFADTLISIWNLAIIQITVKVAFTITTCVI